MLAIYARKMCEKNAKNLAKKYTCNFCDFNSNNKRDYNKHCLTGKHDRLTNANKLTNGEKMANKMANPNVKNLAKKYTCNYCDFKSNNKSDYAKHCETIKHKTQIVARKNPENLANLANLAKNIKIIEYRCDCGKLYKHKSSLSKHKNKCNYNNNDKDDEYAKDDKDDENDKYDKDDNIRSSIIKIMKDNSDKIIFLINENKELKNQIKEQNQQINELIPKVGNTTNNLRQKFNINVFLNEKCKDAISIDEFVSKIEISLKNLLITKDKGIGSGLNDIINDNMNKLSLYERPIHCTDKKRETLYVKHDNWEKDENKKYTNNMLKSLQSQQFKAMKKWQDAHPNYKEDDKLKHEYMILVNKCSSSLNDHEKKIFKNLCNNTYLKSDNIL